MGGQTRFFFVCFFGGVFIRASNKYYFDHSFLCFFSLLLYPCLVINGWNSPLRQCSFHSTLELPIMKFPILTLDACCGSRFLL